MKKAPWAKLRMPKTPKMRLIPAASRKKHVELARPFRKK
jgi:hypothetical protein